MHGSKTFVFWPNFKTNNEKLDKLQLFFFFLKRKKKQFLMKYYKTKNELRSPTRYYDEIAHKFGFLNARKCKYLVLVE